MLLTTTHKISALVLLFLLQTQNAFGFNRDIRFRFADELLHNLTPPPIHQNLVISPASIQTCMAMVYMASNGKTANEMRNGLQLQSFIRKEDVAADFNDFLQSATKANQSKLEMANRIYVDKLLQPLPTFNELTRKHFHSETESVDFGAQTVTANKINNWVKTQTHDKIEHLIDASTLTDDTAVVLVNAIYFKAKWLYTFDSTFTTTRDFHISDREKTQVPTMFRANLEVRYCELPEHELVAIELPYKDTDLRMLILLPNKVDSATKLMKKFDTLMLEKVIRHLKIEKLDLFMPKFKIEFDLSLVDTLKAMGMESLFKDADLHHMVTGASGPLYVKEVKHKAFISVDEVGSEAAGATYVQTLPRSARFHQKVLMINRPFTFVIMDDQAIYFLGHVIKF